ncbi:hypothetical protein [Actinocrinis sp.]|uniref:hypothetical protein n=1 Tax=Actinocrinis sp. TaxID=1920516 RepID=UPI002D5EB8E2|nr:hypothetical protein [Actinocrinis sp.]HZP54626.1 hypothetical protein [Actinocrinis sp.]
MSQHTPEPVQDAARKLMAALALHEDTRNTVESALHDLWDTAHEHTAPVMQLAQLIRDDANTLANGAALTRLAPAARIRERADRILAALQQATATPCNACDSETLPDDKPLTPYGDSDGEPD